jgi:hypothetical protein
MSFVTDKLMDGFTTMRRVAATEGDAAGVNVFSQAEGVVNTVAHAGTDEAILKHCAQVFMERAKDETYAEAERNAYNSAATLTDMIAQVNGIHLNLWGPTRYC